jgi:hypothetical protein
MLEQSRISSIESNEPRLYDNLINLKKHHAYSSLTVLVRGKISLRLPIMRKGSKSYLMSTEVQIDETESKIPSFWEVATKYAHSVEDDESFVEEMAYVMVTLHRNGA